MSGHRGCGCGHNHDDHHGHAHGEFGGAAHLDSGGAPFLVEVTRGGMVESRHRAAAAVVGADGHVIMSWGDVNQPIYARSAIKSLQAIPLVETGAADALEATDEEIALACASHNGEPVHVETATRFLHRIGLSVDDYECGVHLPYDEESAHALIRRDEAPSQAHNNCSGKHAGFLATALYMKEPLKGYVRYDHPVQQRILGVLEQMAGVDLGSAPWGVDGCGIPTIAIPLANVAYAMARMADPKDLPEKRQAAVRRIVKAWGAHPYLIGGRGTFDSIVGEAAKGRFVTKIGAEGVECAVIPEMGLGIALKVEDGASRAASVAMAGILRKLGLIDDAAWDALRAATHPALKNRAGLDVGEIRPAS